MASFKYVYKATRESRSDKTFAALRNHQAIVRLRAGKQLRFAYHLIYCNIASRLAVGLAAARSIGYKSEMVSSNHVVSTFDRYMSAFGHPASHTEAFIQSNAK